jgi:uncharacterized metal-binding protein YceD (DUF177 family)
VKSLKIPLSSIGDGGVHVDVRAGLDDIRPGGAGAVPLIEAVLTGTLLRLDEDFLFRGRVSGEFVRPCDRCLRDVRQVVDCDVDWFFEEGAAADWALSEDERRPISGDEIDLGPHVWEELVLALPAKCVCADVSGCVPAEAYAPPEAGGEGAEDVGAPMNAGFAKLKEMFPDLAREERKE